MLNLILAAILFTTPIADGATSPDYPTQVAPLLKKYCAGCHNDEDREGKFSLETYASMQKGTKHGPALLPGDARGSLLLRVMTGEAKPTMPPKDEPRPSAEEVAVIEAWIGSGARGPQGEAPDHLALLVPRIASRARVKPIVAMDASRDGRFTAVGRDSGVTLYEGTGEKVTRGNPSGRAIGRFPGQVTALHFTPDGKRIVAASGIAGLGGVASIWNVDDGSLVRSFEGHRDLLYDAELSPDGACLATCGYDKTIELREVATGKLLRTLDGHTGAVYDVAFSPDGRFLVSASADDTCKVWRVADGLRMDTLPQPLKAEYTCRFTPDGTAIVAGGADNNLRVWRFVSREQPEINPMTTARFAHEGAIVRLDFSPDGSKLVSLAEDRTVKLWRTSDFTEIQLWDAQSDVVSAVAFAPDGASFDVGRMDGTMETFAIPSPPPETASTDASRLAPTRNRASSPIQEIAEHEPNDLLAIAQPIPLPARISGTIDGGKSGGVDSDVFRFSARAGESWVFEVNAARMGSKLDSYLEVLDGQGHKVPRVLLQAVRDSYFTFRGKNDSESTDFRLFNWDEMAIDDYLYANGEVVKLWLFPRGPDSGFFVYPGQGSRWGYFDTTPLTHALNETCYVVRPHAPGTKLVANGLPAFTIYYENDDDSHRELGKDSRLVFTSPGDGEYLLKIRDVRGLQGADFRYVLTARERRPDFQVTLQGANPTVGAGSAKEFKVFAKRIDGFEGPIRVELAGLPPGFRATSPVIIEPGQIEAFGVVVADPDAKEPTGDAARPVTVTASAQVDSGVLTHDVNALGSIKLDPHPKLRITIVAAEGGAKPVDGPNNEPLEFTIEPGRTILLKVQVERLGFPGQVPFGNEGAGRNLPFGAIIDNLGLNGLLVLENQQERTFFVTADRNLPEQTRLFHLTTRAGAGPSSRPVRLRVVRPRP